VKRRRSISFAERCAAEAVDALRSCGGAEVKRRDLLYGILRHEHTRAARVLRAHGVDPAAVAEAVGGAAAPPANSGKISTALLLAIDFAAAEACLEGCDRIDTGHLLVALARGTRTGHDVHREPLLAASRIAVAWRDGRVSIWDLLRDRGPLTRDAERPAYCVTTDPEGRHVAAGCTDGRIDVWDLDQEIHVRFPDGHKGPVRAVAWSPAAPRVLTGSEDGTAAVWDTERGTKVFHLRAHDAPVRTVAFNPQGELLYTGSDDATIKVWYARTGALVDTLEGHASAVVRLGFTTPRLPLISRSDDDEAILWTDPPQRHAAPEDDVAPILARFHLTADTLRSHLPAAKPFGDVGA
jgi:hypothetical protein